MSTVATTAGRFRDATWTGWTGLLGLAAILGILYALSLVALIAGSLWLDQARGDPGSPVESVAVGPQAEFQLRYGGIDQPASILNETEQAGFQSPSGQIPVFGMEYFREGALWLKFPVPEIASGDTQRTIRLADPRVRQAVLLVEGPNGLVERRWSFDSPERRTGVAGSVPAFHFDEADLRGATATIGFTSLSLLRGSVFVESRQAFEAWTIRQIVLPSIQSGALVALGVYLIAVGIMLGDRPLVAAGGMAFALTTVIFGGPGLVHTYLLPSHPSLADVVAYVPKPLVLSAWLVFLVAYLNLLSRNRGLAAGLLLLAAIIPFQAILASMKVGFDWEPPIRLTSSWPLVIGIVAGLSTLVLYAIKKDRHARLFLLCWAPMAVGTLVRCWIILFPTPRTALWLANETFMDILLSMVLLAIAMVLDIQSRETSLRRDAEAKERRLREYSEIASDSFFETDPKGQVTAAVGPMTGEIGLAPTIHLLGELTRRASPSDGPALRRISSGLIAGNSFRSVELALARDDGSRRWYSLNAVPYIDHAGRMGGFRGTVVDISDQIARRSREAQDAKLVAMGQIAGGIAHEVNNLLHPIVNLSRRVRDHNVSDADGKKLLDMVIDSGKRAGEVVEGVLDAVSPSSRRGPLLPISQAVQRASATVIASLPPDLKVKIAIESISEPALPTGEMLQVMSNLIQNAHKSLKPQGQIQVSLRDGAAEGYGDGVLLCVSDNGAGMAPEIRDRALEPFVTSRPDGTGLGLATVAAIVNLWGGGIDIQSTPDVGTAVTIRIPKNGGARNGDIG